MAKIVYMLHEVDGDLAGGPLLGDPGLDFAALAAEFRTLRYAQCEAAGEDYCFISEGDFVSWLLEGGILSPMDLKPVGITVEINTSGEHRYIPKHWPVCPECGEGRGETHMGRVIHELNRCEWHFKCTECEHTWGHHDEPYNYQKPMLDDDGRCIPSSCVPYSISQAGGLPMDQVLKVCQEHGWSQEGGMDADRGVEAARRIGLYVSPGRIQMTAGKLTLRRVLNTLSPAKNYIVATRGHWLAVVQGENRDQADTGMRAEVVGFWEIRAPTQT